jgi:hypothetical protein
MFDYSIFLEIKYTSCSTGRIELWMELTEEKDEDGCYISKPVREPTPDDLSYAERSEAGLIRYVRATAFLPMIPNAEQIAINSENFDIEMPEEVTFAMLNLLDNVNRACRERLTERVQRGDKLERIPDGCGFNYRPVERGVEWTEITKKKES